SYQLQDGGGADIGAPITGDRTQGVFINVAPGDYRVVVTDTETLCTATATMSLVAAIPPVIDSVLETDISCKGDGDGSINVQLRPGTDVDGPMVYRLLNFDSRAMISSNNS